MRILISSESYWPNLDGGAVFEHWLVHELIREGHEVCVVAPGDSLKSSEEKDGDSIIYRTSSGPLPLSDNYKVSYRAMPTASKAIDDFHPDVIHINTMALTGSALLKLAKKSDIPIVATNHLMPENVFMSLPSFIKDSKALEEKFWSKLVDFHNKFDAVTSPTPSATRLLREHGLVKPLYDISNGIDVAKFSPLPDSRKKAVRSQQLKRFKIPGRYVLYLGRVNAEKRIDMLIDSFARICDETDADLVIAGSGNRENELKQQAKSLKISERVHFLGRVSDEEKVALYQCAELFAITSPAELQSIVTLEAMACGLPLVTVDVVALSELCHDKKNGFLVDLDDNQACANAMLVILNDDNIRKRFGKYSRDFVKNHHDSRLTLAKFTKLYDSSIRGKFPNNL